MMWLAPIVSFCLTYLGLVWLIKNKWGPWDYPNERSLHSAPVLRTGGLAIVAGVSIGLVLIDYDKTLMLLGAVVFLAALSFFDDLYDLSPAIRFFAHLGIALSAAWVWRPELALWQMGLLTLALVWIINLYNFMDGADGLAAGMAVFGFGAYGLAAWLLAETSFAALNLAIAATALAFLRFNFPPARIFMGDAGSIPLGFLAGAIGLMGWEKAVWPAWFPFLVFSPFIVDATLTLARRWVKGEPIWLAHRQHYYQKLVQSGLGQRKIALFAYLLMFASGLSALLGLRLNQSGQYFLLGVWACGYFFVVYQLERLLGKSDADVAPPSI